MILCNENRSTLSRRIPPTRTRTNFCARWPLGRGRHRHLAARYIVRRTRSRMESIWGAAMRTMLQSKLAEYFEQHGAGRAGTLATSGLKSVVFVLFCAETTCFKPLFSCASNTLVALLTFMLRQRWEKLGTSLRLSGHDNANSPARFVGRLFEGRIWGRPRRGQQSDE